MIDYFKSRQFKVSLIPGLSLVEDAADEISLVSEYGRFPMKRVSAGVLNAFRALARGDRTEEELAKEVLDTDGIGGLTGFNHYYAQCVLRCFIRYGVYAENVRLMSLMLTVPVRRFELSDLAADKHYVLSRFAYSRKQNDGLILETPLFGAKISLDDWRAAALLSLLSSPLTPAEIAEKAPFLSSENIAGMLKLLKASKLLCLCGDKAKADEDENPSLRQWEFQDLLFHSRSRIGRHNNPIGATFRYVGVIPPPPLIKESTGEKIPLYQPDLNQIENGRTLLEVMESRRSVRAFGKEPISVEQLGEFLYRVARIRAFWNFELKAPDGTLVETLQLSNRPYPGGGAIYEMELYLTIDRCRGLAPGLYRYNPMEHVLIKVPADDARLAGLLQDACLSAAITQKPQVLITLAARFQRLTWKYTTIAYAATLKNVGVLYQTMYLVATAMGLAPCALGSGNSELFAEAAGTDYYAETSVGEFMLGTLPEVDQPVPWANDLDFIPNTFLQPQAN